MRTAGFQQLLARGLELQMLGGAEAAAFDGADKLLLPQVMQPSMVLSAARKVGDDLFDLRPMGKGADLEK